MKTCRLCGEDKEDNEFHKTKSNKDGLDSRCKSCRKKEAAEDYRKNWFRWTVKLKKSYCLKHNIPFDLTEEHLKNVWTDSCPVFGTPFELFDKKSDRSPTLDRVDPEKGYVIDNVRYISARANRIKYDATVEELLLIVKYMEGATTIPEGSTLK